MDRKFIILFTIAFGMGAIAAFGQDGVESEAAISAPVMGEEKENGNRPAKGKGQPEAIPEEVHLFTDPSLALSEEPAGRNQGIIRGYDARGNLFFTVEYRRKRMDGAWQSQYPDGLVRDRGQFYKNVPDGEWRGYYANGNPKFVRQYSAAKWFAVHGEIKRKHPKLRQYPLTDLASSHPDFFAEVVSSGYSFHTLPQAASSYTPPFSQCLHHGIYLNYYDNGALKDSGYYKDGLRDGVWQEWHENRLLKSSGFYINGKKHGGWAYYNAKGELTSLKEYRYGELLHEKSYTGLLRKF